jgi:hypothetical protein
MASEPPTPAARTGNERVVDRPCQWNSHSHRSAPSSWHEIWRMDAIGSPATRVGIAAKVPR